MWFFEIIRRPGFLPSLAALFIAGGIESDNLYLHHSLEIIGAVIAFIGLFAVKSGDNHAVRADSRR